MTARYDPAWVERFYDDYGETEWHRLVKDPTNEVKLHVHRHYLEQHVRAGDRVLEIGPGPGRFTQILAALGARLVLVDISAGQLALNDKYAAEHSFAHAIEGRLKLDICDMSALADGSFDAVVAYGGPVSYVFEEAPRALAEIVRVLVPGGVALLSVMSLWGAVHEFLPGVLALPPEVNRPIVATGDLCPATYPEANHHAHMYRAAELRDVLEREGLEVIEMSASNCLSAARGDQLDEVRQDETQWAHLLEMELEACREPGCVDLGTHTIAVARRIG